MRTTLFKGIFVSALIFSFVLGNNIQADAKVLFQDTDKVNNVAESVTGVRAMHILVKTRAEAEAVRKQILDGKDFSAAAKEVSTCPSGQNGGDLGYFSRGMMVPEFEEAAFNLPVGQVSEPVKTQFGWHLIEVTDKR